jgi:hypothetical protein
MCAEDAGFICQNDILQAHLGHFSLLVRTENALNPFGKVANSELWQLLGE